jgi:ppGpp synthetase/RelA/SpoT-type nucleotidyltranferase
VYAAYAVELDEWRDLAAYVQERLETALAAAGIHAWVFARAKTPESFTNKVVLGGKKAEEIGDRAAARVVLAYQEQAEEVEKLIIDAFNLIKRESKLDALAYNETGYLGVHLDVRLRDSDPDHERFGDRPVEIQVRTIAQSSWAEVAHEQIYKPAIEVPDELKRRIYRLVALVELFDNEVAGFVEEARALPGYQAAHDLRPLANELYARFGVVPRPDRLAALQLAGAITPLYGVPSSELVATVLTPWLAEHEDEVRIQLEGAAKERHPFAAQPEVLMLFERLDHAPAQLAAEWPSPLPRQLLERLAELWGVEL